MSVEAVVSFLQQTAGRDKICATTQFSCWTAIALAREGRLQSWFPDDKRKRRLAALGNIMAHMGLCRKTLRFGKIATIYRGLVGTISRLKLAINAGKITPALINAALKVVDLASLFVFMPLDHTLWLNTVGAIQLSPEMAKRIGWWVNFCWFLDILTNFMLIWNKYLNHPTRSATIQNGVVRSARPTRKQVIWDSTRSVLDFWFCLSLLGFDIASFKTQGLLGLTANLMNMWQMWKGVNNAIKSKKSS